MLKTLALALLLLQQTIVYPPGAGVDAVGATPIPEPVLQIGLGHYWTMSEATGATRVDSVASNDFTVTTGPATQVAAHLGNGTDQATLDASGFTAGVDGYTLGWWQAAISAGTPTVTAIYTLTGQGSVVCVANPGLTNVDISVNGRPGGGAKGYVYSAPVSPEAWHFFVLVVDSLGVTTYQGDDTGAALDAQFEAWDGGDSFVAPTALNFVFGSPWLGLTLDDMFQYSRPLSAAEVGLLYNSGAGEPLF